MKKVLLPIILLMATLQVAKAQTDFCKDITKTVKDSKVIYETPTPGDKNENVSSFGFFKIIDSDGSRTYFKLGISLGEDADMSITDASITFEDNDIINFSNLTIKKGQPVKLLTETDYLYSTLLTLNAEQLEKLKTKKIASYTILGKKRVPGFGNPKVKIMAYANCLDGLNETFKPTLNANEKKSIDGFWGIKFGTSSAEAKTALEAKGGKATLKSKPELLIFTNAEFTGRTTSYIALYMVNDKFYMASVGFPELDDIHLIPTFNTIVSELSAVYGDAKVSKVFKDPYKEGDGMEAGAIRVGMASYNASWKTNNGNTIVVQINKDSTINIFYTDRTLEKTKSAQKSADY